MADNTERNHTGAALRVSGGRHMVRRRICICLTAAVIILMSVFPAYADSGWLEDQFGRWYVNEDGSFPTSRWQQINNVWYYFKESGYMATGPVLVEGVEYYLHESGAMAADEWIEHRGRWYYFTSDGSMARESWIGDIHYVDKNGIMVKDRRIDGIYIDEEGEAEHPEDFFQ